MPRNGPNVVKHAEGEDVQELETKMEVLLVQENLRIKDRVIHGHAQVLYKQFLLDISLIKLYGH